MFFVGIFKFFGEHPNRWFGVVFNLMSIFFGEHPLFMFYFFSVNIHCSC